MEPTKLVVFAVRAIAILKFVYDNFIVPLAELVLILVRLEIQLLQVILPRRLFRA